MISTYYHDRDNMWILQKEEKRRKKEGRRERKKTPAQAFLCVLASFDDLEDDGEEGNEDDGNDDGEEVLIHVWDDGTQEESKNRDSDAPQQGTDDVVAYERRVLHRADASKYGCKSAHHRYEARKNNGAGAVFLVERLSTLEVLLVQEEAAGLLKEASAVASTKPVACRVAQYGSDDDQCNECE